MLQHSLHRLDLAVRRNVTLADFADQMADIWGARRVVTEAGSGEEMSYRQMADRVARWSDAIAAQIQPGEPVVLATPNSYDQFLLCLAVCRAGGLAAPVNGQMRAGEIDHVIADSGASLVVRSTDELRIDAPPCSPATPDASDVAALFYTSGTTGTPKGAALTHRALVGQSTIATLWPARLHRDEVVVSLPVAHIMGFITLIGLATAAMPTYFMTKFNAVAVLDAIERRDATGFVGVPAMYRMMLEAGASDRDLSSIRIWVSGADVMPTELARAFKSFGASASLPWVGAIGEAAFVEGYGMVEVGGGVAAKFSPPFSRLGVGETVGFRLPGYRFKVVDDQDRGVPMGGLGELWIKGPGVLKGYWNAPTATAEAMTPDGWLRTGDLVRVGPFGTVVFCGRRKHVIKSGGYSVYPLEIEGVLEEHPEIVEASVVGLDDPKLGQVPVAAVRLSDGSMRTPADVLAWGADHLASYKAPRRVIVVDDLPRTGTEKVQKELLAGLFAS